MTLIADDVVFKIITKPELQNDGINFCKHRYTCCTAENEMLLKQEALYFQDGPYITQNPSFEAFLKKKKKKRERYAFFGMS